MDIEKFQDIRRLREKAGLTQQQLAELSGVSVSGICKYEKGNGNPKYLTTAKLVKALESVMGNKDDYPYNEFLRKEPTENIVAELKRRGFRVYLELI